MCFLAYYIPVNNYEMWCPDRKDTRIRGEQLVLQTLVLMQLMHLLFVYCLSVFTYTVYLLTIMSRCGVQVEKIHQDSRRINCTTNPGTNAVNASTICLLFTCVYLYCIPVNNYMSRCSVQIEKIHQDSRRINCTANPGTNAVNASTVCLLFTCVYLYCIPVNNYE